MNELPPVEALLPHRGALLWIDAIEVESSGRAHCSARIRADNPFLLEGRLPALAICELLSQAGAVLSGIEAGHRDELAGPGYLVAIRELDLARVGDLSAGADLVASVYAEARRADPGGEYCVVRGEVAVSSRPVAAGELVLLRLPKNLSSELAGSGAVCTWSRRAAGPLPQLPAAALLAEGAREGPLPGLSLGGISVEDTTLGARLEVSAACPLFADHFPGHPVLPAVAELLVVAWAARRAGWLERDPRAVGRTKFLRPISPASVLELALRKEGGALRWSLSGEATVASGELLLPTGE